MWNYIRKYRVTIIIVLTLIFFKIVWVSWACWNTSSVDKEKNDILERQNYLKDKIIVEPIQLLNEMPGSIGIQFQGEWALYSCSMLSKALINISTLYPETKPSSIQALDSLINIVISPELRLYDKLSWNEDPLDNLESNNSHVSYLSHLAWIIGNYKNIGGGNSYDALYDSICKTLNRRILESPCLNIPTYPGEPIYIPDMMVAIVALKEYSEINERKFKTTIDKWLLKAKKEWIDEETGLLASFLTEDGIKIGDIKGSYSALNCYYLTLIDPEFAKDQYTKLKTHFYKSFPFDGLKEYYDRSCLFGIDIDAGPILFNLSPSGTAFAIGCATFFNDWDYRRRLLTTAEIAGHTIKWRNKRHYMLANVFLVGEAITLAMRTNYENL